MDATALRHREASNKRKLVPRVRPFVDLGAANCRAC